MKVGPLAAAASSLGALLLIATPAPAEDCRLALVLALDASASVDQHEYGLQRHGLARAIVNPEIARLFLAGPPVAVYAFEWAGPSMQEPLTSAWLVVRSMDDVVRLAGLVSSHPRPEGDNTQRTTAVGAALAYAASALERAPACTAWTVDVSGDGQSNSGLAPRQVYASGQLAGVTVNALVIVGADLSSSFPGADNRLITWFRSNVLHGRGAFLVAADGYEDFERAIREKLLRELETPTVAAAPQISARDDRAPEGGEADRYCLGGGNVDSEDALVDICVLPGILNGGELDGSSNALIGAGAGQDLGTPARV